MLRELSIRNFAIIDDLKISFSEGFTILSGETGAGKSIIVNAVNLLLGTRATAKLIRTGAETAEIEALFDIPGDGPSARTIAKHGYDISDGLLIRRLISRKERHRIFVNGRLATMQLLMAITETLASISGQHAHQVLLKEDEHLNILDLFGDLIPLRKKVGQHYREILPLIRELRKLRSSRKRQSDHLDLLEFQRKEILSAEIEPGEDSALETERTRLKNAEVLYDAAHQSIEDLYAAQGAVTERLAEIRKRIEKAAGIDPTLSPMATGISTAAFQIEDITHNLRSYRESVQIDEKRLEAVEERLDALHRLKRKYGNSIEKIQERLGTIEAELAGVESLSERIDDTRKRLEKSHLELSRTAAELSTQRKEIAGKLAKKIEAELTSLRMEKTRFRIFLDTIDAPPDADPYLTADAKVIGETGMDRASFMIAPNVGEEMKPLSAIASGGELSRVILALKAILSGVHSVETIVFDEVDSGIGGGVAEVVGKKLSALARYHQIICITHLPQIAKFGNTHLRISKHLAHGRTVTKIAPLGEEERVTEIARMLGGEKITPTTLAHAREMLTSTG